MTNRKENYIMEEKITNTVATQTNNVVGGLSDRAKGRLEGAGIAFAVVGLIRAGKKLYDTAVDFHNKKVADQYLKDENPGVVED